MTGGGQVVPAPTDLELKVLLVIGSESIDGFDGWMDTGIAWRYDWHQRTINRAYHCSETGYRIKPFISIYRHFVSVTKKTIHVVIVHIYGKIM